MAVARISIGPAHEADTGSLSVFVSTRLVVRLKRGRPSSGKRCRQLLNRAPVQVIQGAWRRVGEGKDFFVSLKNGSAQLLAVARTIPAGARTDDLQIGFSSG